MLGTAVKTQDCTLDYDVDFGEWLGPGDEVINGNAYLDEGVEIVIDNLALYGPTMKIWISGGEPGKEYSIYSMVQTKIGRVKQAHFKLKVIK